MLKVKDRSETCTGIYSSVREYPEFSRVAARTDNGKLYSFVPPGAVVFPVFSVEWVLQL